MLLIDIIISAILAAIFAPLLTYLLYYLKKLKTSKYINRFWNFPRKEHVLIVFPKSEKRPDHDTGRVVERSLNMYGAMAVAVVNNLLGKLDIESRLVASDATLSDRDKEANLVLIGGTRGNDVCANICKKVEKKLKVYWFEQPGPQQDNRLSNRDTNEFYMTGFADEKKEIIGVDHALVLKFRNPSNPENTVIVLAGNYGAGTLAAARAALDNEVLSKVHKSVDVRDSLGFVVKCCPKDFDVREYEWTEKFFNITEQH